MPNGSSSLEDGAPFVSRSVDEPSSPDDLPVDFFEEDSEKTAWQQQAKHQQTERRGAE